MSEELPDVVSAKGPTVQQVAVIDVGATSIRMAIAEIREDDSVRMLESLTQAISVGKDTFTRGYIDKSTIEDCVRVLRSYRRVLEEYQIHGTDQIRAVATSAVREATNRLAFIDRIFIATGIQIETLDAAEVNRITFSGVHPFLKEDPALCEARAVVTEVGGGSTELLLVDHGAVVYSQTYRLGSLRLRETLEAYRTPKSTTRSIIESQIRRTVEQIAGSVLPGGDVEMIALGGDLRFATAQLLPTADPARLTEVRVEELAEFTESILSMTEDRLVARYHLTFPEAETLGAALLANVQMARSFGLERLFVGDINLRDGLIREIAGRGAWTEDFREQVSRSALELGRRFQFSETHARHVAELCGLLFASLQQEHQLDSRYEMLLKTAALLHEIGMFVNVGSYHKHSMYLIMNSDLFGLSRRDLLLVSLIARYHRRASPKPTHQGYATLDRDLRVTVMKLAAILRLADALDTSHSQRIKEISIQREQGRFVAVIPHIDDLSLEQLALKQSGTLFEETYGMPVMLRKLRR